MTSLARQPGVGLVDQRSQLVGHHAGQQILDADVVHHRANGRAQPDPQLAEVLRRTGVGDVLGPLLCDECERTVDRPSDIGTVIPPASRAST